MERKRTQSRRNKETHQQEKEHNGKTRQDGIGHDYHGVGMILSSRALVANLDVEHINRRQMYILQHAATRHLCIIDGYAPHTKRPTSETYSFYEAFEHTYNKLTSSYITIILGYVNAILHYRLETDKQLVGPNMFGRGEEYVQQL